MTQTKHPEVTFLASSLLGKVPLEPRWAGAYLPIERTEAQQDSRQNWTYGQYFQTVDEVLARDSYTLLLEAVQKQLAALVHLSDLQEILIYAEKHGNFYHPAKIEVKTPGGTARFALNVALTERGAGVMSREVKALQYLAANYPYASMPSVYFFIDAERISPSPSAPTQRIGMFLTDWLEGFYEFHLSEDPEDRTRKLLIWDGSPKPNFLSVRQTQQVYRQISKMLTLYYHPQTYEQIFPWHHGAGDFIVKINGEKETEIRLVTVRQYAALMDPVEMSEEEALLFFFLNLSLRMRLDRLNGVGEVVWAEKLSLDMTWAGFLEGLKIKEKEGVISPSFLHSFLGWLRDFSPSALAERFSALLGSYDPEAPDLPVINENIVPHILGVYEIFKEA